MTKLTGPLHSMLASGLLQTGLQLVQGRKSCHLVRPHIPTQRRTRSQVSLRTYVESLAGWWHEYSVALGYLWESHPRAKTTSPYHAFLWENHQRRLMNLWPIAAWGVAPSGTPPASAGTYWRGAARTISFRVMGYTGLRPMVLAGMATPLVVANPLNIQAWSWESPTHFREHLIRHLAAGTYTAQWRYVDAFGRMSTFSGATGLVVTG